MPKIDGAYLGYIYECERQEKINQLINQAFRLSNDDFSLDSLCILVGLDSNTLTKDEIEYITSKSGGWIRKGE